MQFRPVSRLDPDKDDGNNFEPARSTEIYAQYMPPHWPLT